MARRFGQMTKKAKEEEIESRREEQIKAERVERKEKIQWKINMFEKRTESVKIVIEKGRLKTRVRSSERPDLKVKKNESEIVESREKIGSSEECKRDGVGVGGEQRGVRGRRWGTLKGGPKFLVRKLMETVGHGDVEGGQDECGGGSAGEVKAVGTGTIGDEKQNYKTTNDYQVKFWENFNKNSIFKAEIGGRLGGPEGGPKELVQQDIIPSFEQRIPGAKRKWDGTR